MHSTLPGESTRVVGFWVYAEWNANTYLTFASRLVAVRICVSGRSKWPSVEGVVVDGVGYE
ncbi:predicted protein [Botrytis cinerea T4]|uniref:Uncharacterized protein n=1 Tax=Botryotinia fuckeliana (strain T4) TaxID=999810 RepID=G2XXQ8_BOTF4|nr:predicted protein [Botrytis cinerea T4]